MKKIFGILTVLTALVSCKKDDSTPDTKCFTDILYLTGSYKTTAIKYKASNSSPEQDYFALLDACEKDDVVKLNANGTADYQDAGTVCSPNGTYSSTWSLNGNTIIMDGTAGTIQSFDCKKLIVSVSGALVPGDTYTVTYEKQ
jgi:hypothetical protein